MLQPKISVIMQAYLGDYPGSRTNSIDKFIRAINTYKAQTYSNSELIVVSDGCSIVHETYNSYFKSDPKIKYAYVEKKGTPNMYEHIDGKKYYRGVPRQVGVTLADGDLITYMDSDDFLLPNFLESIVQEFNKHPDLDFYSNGSWFDNHIATWPETNAMFPSDRSIKYQVPGLDSEWIITRMKPGMLTMAPWLFIHKKVDDIQWKDTTETSEDVDFNTRFRKKYKVGIQINTPSYVRCHYSQLWDY